MIGCYDFCGHYDWTFRWLQERGGRSLLVRYWEEAICKDSQRHAADLIEEKGVEGMEEYWGETLADEAPDGGYRAARGEGSFWIEMTDCPSRGFLLRNGIEFSGDYCDHCIGWIGPLMEKAGYAVDHDHNHCGQCWWEFRRRGHSESPSEREEERRQLTEHWKEKGDRVDQFRQAVHPDDKT